MDAGVSYLPLPVDKELVVLGQTGKDTSFQGVILDVFDAALNLALMPWCVRFGGQEYEVVMPGKSDDLRVQFGVKPVRILDRRLQVVNHQCFRNTAKGVESIL